MKFLKISKKYFSKIFFYDINNKASKFINLFINFDTWGVFSEGKNPRLKIFLEWIICKGAPESAPY